LEWNLLPGDFRDLQLVDLPAPDLVYFDFYAPAKCPELWTHAVFKKLYAQMVPKPDSLLITYASNKAIRAAMLLAGFFVGEGAQTSMKLHTTVASPTLEALQRPIGADWLKGFECSSKQLPVDWTGSQSDEGVRRVREHSQFKR
jgi:queuine tRNA-ribosyltransferase